jgi:hypothetical protein
MVAVLPADGWGIVIREPDGVRGGVCSPKGRYRLWGLLFHRALGTHFRWGKEAGA